MASCATVSWLILVWDANVRNLRAGVGHFNHHVPCQLTLHCEVPLLRVATAEGGIYREYSLAQTGIGRRRNRSHAGP